MYRETETDRQRKRGGGKEERELYANVTTVAFVTEQARIPRIGECCEFVNYLRLATRFPSNCYSVRFASR